MKALYELRRHWDGSIVWTNTIPKQEKAEDVGRKALAGLILRYVKSERDDGEIEYELSSVIIRSTNLRKALDEALAGEEVVHFGLKRVQIDRPFQPFLRQWPRMQAKLTECTDDSPPCRMFRQFHDIIFTEIESTLNEIKDLVDHKVIKSEHVWALFEPGEMLFSPRYNEAYIFQHCEAECSRSYSICGRKIDYDGRSFKSVSTVVTIGPFEGVQPIQSLPIFPIKFY